MRFGDPLTIVIERMDDKGRGVGNGAAVPFALPGEKVEGAFAGRLKGLARLDDAKIVEASPDRVAPECPHAGTCGGCAWQHVRYERQLAFKRMAVARSFKEAGLDLEVPEIVPAAERLHHRNRMDYVFGPDGQLGLKEPGRWDRHLDLSTCLLLSGEGFECVRRVRAWARTTPHAPWDNRRHAGFLRYLVVREGKETGERMATLVTAPGTLEKEKELVAALAPLCTTVYHGVNPRLTDLSVADELRLLHGQPYLHERVGEVTYPIHPNAFFQTNTRMAEVLLAHVKELAASGPLDRLLDLYCGGGFFALALARQAKDVLGVELDAEAIRAAELAAKENGVGNVRFRAEAAEKLSWETERPDLVIVDPPRSGLHPSVRRTLLAHRPPRLVYVSCGHRALGVDLRELLRAYDAVSLRGFDLFPHTPHVETVVHLKAKV